MSPELRRTVESSETIHHNCGLVGIVTESHSKRAHLLARGSLLNLQHRGEEAAGMAWLTHGEISHFNRLGKIEAAIPLGQVENFASTRVVVGHTRYSTSGNRKKDKERGNVENVQPFVFGRRFAIAANGNSPNFKYPVADEEPTSDTYKIGKAIDEGSGPLIENVISVMSTLAGAYTFLFITKNGLYVARDPWGVRPAWIAELDNGIRGTIIASETIAFQPSQARVVGTIPRGVLAKVTPQGLEIIWKDPRRVPESNCSFEKAYFADQTSQVFPHENQKIEGSYTHHSLRIELGRRVAQTAEPEGDSVVAIPDSGWSYAEGVGQELDLRLNQAIHKNRNVGRTFTQPNLPDERMRAAFEKYNFIPENIKGRRLIVVDDSIVRGYTIKSVVITLFNYGAEEIHLVSGIPPVIEICDKGIDFQSRSELIYVKLAAEILGKHPDYVSFEDLADQDLRTQVETKLVSWLVDDDPELKRRLKVSYQEVDDYIAITQDVPKGTPSSESGGCHQCVTGLSPSGIIYRANGSIVIPSIGRRK